MLENKDEELGQEAVLIVVVVGTVKATEEPTRRDRRRLVAEIKFIVAGWLHKLELSNGEEEEWVDNSSLQGDTIGVGVYWRRVARDE